MGTLASGVSRIKTHTKIKYQYLTYSTSFDTLTTGPFCPTSPIAPVLRRRGIRSGLGLCLSLNKGFRKDPFSDALHESLTTPQRNLFFGLTLSAA